MKKTFFFLISIFILFSCTSQLNDESIVGTWQVTDFESNTNLSPILIASAKKLAKTFRYQINADHTIGWKDSFNFDGYLGQWELDAKQKRISFSFENPQSKIESTYEILELNNDEMKWFEDMGEFGQNIITLKRCNACAFEISPPIEVNESELKELDEMVLSSTILTDAYCECMEETKKRESCIEPYDNARFEIKLLSDFAIEKFNIQNEYASSNNKYIILVKELREKLVYCRNGLRGNF